jgi:hypothetical protein
MIFKDNDTGWNQRIHLVLRKDKSQK